MNEDGTYSEINSIPTDISDDLFKDCMERSQEDDCKFYNCLGSSSSNISLPVLRKEDFVQGFEELRQHGITYE